MSFTASYPPEGDEPTRESVDEQRGLTVLEFGAGWCGWCQGAQRDIESALSAHAGELRHVKVSDGRGRPLGRSFRVKLWPTLVVLKDGVEVARVVRPQSAGEISTALSRH